MSGVRAELVAVVVAVERGTPYVLASGEPPHLPSGPLGDQQRSLQGGARDFVAEQTGHELGHVEQLYTFADADRLAADGRVVSISYLGLTRAEHLDAAWTPLYDLLPWEDRRTDSAWSRAEEAPQQLESALLAWADRADGDAGAARRERVAYLFGLADQPWRPELVLQRYEVLWEAMLLPESNGRPGRRMLHDHRRILATALSRLRSTLQYRPMVFELVPDTFTLGYLQEVVEALAGQPLHTQNFRRLIETQHRLVEPTDRVDRSTGGRPARLYRFRGELVRERQHVGTKLPLPRSR